MPIRLATGCKAAVNSTVGASANRLDNFRSPRTIKRYTGLICGYRALHRTAAITNDRERGRKP
jgi:hypothetical protein